MELIDTLWNVNILADTLKKGKDVELIDTLWNVNEDKEWYLEMQS